ncbi:hypothetical protein NQZ68_013288 [Dissostichus eleginoides]|nr:hypothetical protein NQZ68_013288 [Dissostichus eleginoides]
MDRGDPLGDRFWLSPKKEWGHVCQAKRSRSSLLQWASRQPPSAGGDKSILGLAEKYREKVGGAD